MDTKLNQLYSVFCKFPKVVTDTRALEKDSIFFALKGENFNGNEFAEKAISNGCVLAVVDEEKFATNEKILVVDNVLETLQKLANLHRRNLKIPIVGITGSNGKTTTKELINQVLSQKYKTSATVGNLNNHIGVPLTLLRINKTHEMGIVEMGANHVGEIEVLCEIALPDFGIITNIGKAHLEGFGGEAGVIKAKSELYVHMKKNGGTAFVNSDNALLNKLSADLKRVTYGTQGADFTGEILDNNPYVKFRCASKTAQLSTQPVIQSQLIGAYNFENILAAACIGNYFGIESGSIKKAIESYIPSNNRSQVVKKGSNTIFLDAYNANPTSMEAAIQNFASMNFSNKVLILGDMLELGKESEREHQKIIELLKEKNLNNVFLVGTYFSKVNNTVSAQRFQTANELIEVLKKNKIENSNILIKGSRGIKLETTLDVL